MATQNTNSTRDTELPEEVVDRLAGLLPAEALEDALEGLEPEEITGPGGLLGQLAGRVIETALGAELAEHLGYPSGQAPAEGDPHYVVAAVRERPALMRSVSSKGILIEISSSSRERFGDFAVRRERDRHQHSSNAQIRRLPGVLLSAAPADRVGGSAG